MEKICQVSSENPFLFPMIPMYSQSFQRINVQIHRLHLILTCFPAWCLQFSHFPLGPIYGTQNILALCHLGLSEGYSSFTWQNKISGCQDRKGTVNCFASLKTQQNFNLIYQLNVVHQLIFTVFFNPS